MYWQFLNDKDGKICRKTLETAGVDWAKYRFIDGNRKISEGTQTVPE